MRLQSNHTRAPYMSTLWVLAAGWLAGLLAGCLAAWMAGWLVGWACESGRCPHQRLVGASCSTVKYSIIRHSREEPKKLPPTVGGSLIGFSRASSMLVQRPARSRRCPRGAEDAREKPMKLPPTVGGSFFGSSREWRMMLYFAVLHGAPANRWQGHAPANRSREHLLLSLARQAGSQPGSQPASC
jgi:hypothetical protein